MLIAATWIALAAAAGAEPGPSTAYELQWIRAPGAESCIGARELAAAVSARLGRPAFDGAGNRVVLVEGQVRPAGTAWHVTITIRDADGTARGSRELDVDGADCRALDAPLALVLALIVDPAASWDAPPPPLPVTAPPAIVTPVRVDAPGSALRLEALVSGAGAVGLLPDAVPGARISLRIGAPRVWPVELGVAWWATDDVEVGFDRRVSLRRWQASAALCTPARRAGRARLDVCAAGELGRLLARGVGFDPDRSTVATLALAAVTGRAAVDVAGPAFAAIEAGAEVPLVRPRILDDTGGEIYRPDRVSVFAALGVGVRF